MFHPFSLLQDYLLAFFMTRKYNNYITMWQSISQHYLLSVQIHNTWIFFAGNYVSTMLHLYYIRMRVICPCKDHVHHAEPVEGGSQHVIYIFSYNLVDLFTRKGNLSCCNPVWKMSYKVLMPSSESMSYSFLSYLCIWFFCFPQRASPLSVLDVNGHLSTPLAAFPPW